VKLDPMALPDAVQRSIEREIGISLATGSDVARRI
jgi:hypothetical protein